MVNREPATGQLLDDARRNGASSASHAALDDILDLDKHKLANVPERQSSAAERWMKYLGFPIGIAVFLLIFYMPLPTGLTASGQAVLACFALALVWWVCEPVPTYLTSLILMIALVFTNGWDQEHVLGVLGFDVIWLNVMAFVLSSILVKTALAKRLALTLIIRFGHNASKMFLAFIVLQLCLAPLIPATAPRAVMTLPLMLVVAAIYGSTSDKVNNFGRNLFLQNLLGVNIFSSGFMTGSTANLIAISLIMSLSGEKVYYTDWMFASLPVVIVTMLLAWFFGPRLLIRMRPEERKPVIEGGIATLKRQLERMGGISFQEKKAAFIFGLVIFLWVTDRFHMQWFGFEINPVMAAMAGAVITFLPKIGLIKWNEADIPWHLMLFSAGAYAGGLALDNSGAARWAINNLFQHLHIGKGTNFWVVYRRHHRRQHVRPHIFHQQDHARHHHDAHRHRRRPAVGLPGPGPGPAGGLHHRLGHHLADQRQAERHLLQYRAVLRPGQHQVRPRRVDDRGHHPYSCRHDLVPLAGDHAMNAGANAMKRKAAGAVALLLFLGLMGYGQQLSRYAETVTLAGNGSARIRLRLEFRGPSGPQLLIPVRHESVHGLDVQGVAPTALRLVEKGGNRFLALDLPVAAAPAAVEVAFAVDDYFKAGGSPGPFGNRKLGYRFVNVSFAGIEKFSAALVLPSGYVFNAVSDFSPQPESAGMVAPFTISREDGRSVGRIAIDHIGLGDEVALSCTFRSGRRSKLLLVILALMALAYLVFFRDLLREKKDVAAAKP